MNKSKKIPENTLRQMKIKSTTFPNLWNAAKEVLRGKFIVIQSYLKKQEKHQIENLTLHPKQLENVQQQKRK